MKYVASCSFGKDSLAMVLRLLEERKQLDEVIFYDTGMEFDSIYRNRDKVKDLLYDENIRYTELKPKNNFLYNMLIKPVKYRNPQDEAYHYGYEWCGAKGVRWGTTDKTSAIQRHYKKLYGGEEICEYIGIAYDEPKRIEVNERKLYPLVEWQMTEKDCLQYCYDRGFDWQENGIELYDVLDRVSCWCCANKNLKELKNIYLYLPEYWQRLRGLQNRIDMPMKGEGKSVFELEERFEKEIESDKNMLTLFD